MKFAILAIAAAIAVALMVLNPRIAFDHSRPVYVVSCRTEWTAHWWGAFGDGGLFGLYSLNSAAQATVANTAGLEYVSANQQLAMAMSTLMKPCR
ncbi:MAG: methanol dehydrogenase [Prochlorococcus sp.]|nr:methanol dehydrogenase [Prochlorococcus sp.]CAI8170194.1 MAG: Uncharacterised protein [Prochlorococcus marinus str. MIT 9215]